MTIDVVNDSIVFPTKMISNNLEVPRQYEDRMVRGMVPRWNHSESAIQDSPDESDFLLSRLLCYKYCMTFCLTFCCGCLNPFIPLEVYYTPTPVK